MCIVNCFLTLTLLFEMSADMSTLQNIYESRLNLKILHLIFNVIFPKCMKQSLRNHLKMNVLKHKLIINIPIETNASFKCEVQDFGIYTSTAGSFELYILARYC